MSLLVSCHDYLSRMFSLSGLKCFLLDEETMPMAGLIAARSELLAHQIFNIERIDKSPVSLLAPSSSSSPKFHHLKAIVFIRPVASSVEALKALIQSEKYKEYYIYFSNAVPSDLLSSLASIDDYSLIKGVHEFYLDYYALSHHIFAANLKHSRLLYNPPAYLLAHEKSILTRNIECLSALCLSLKKRPEVRHCAASDPARLVANGLGKLFRDESELFSFTPSPNPEFPSLLYILDRRDDPVTPLLSQWTYQAMVHELLTIDNNRVDMRNTPGIRKDLTEVVLNAENDPFFRGSQFLNFGDLGNSIKTLVQEYQRKTKTTTKIDSIEDMQRFVDNYPEFRQMSGNVSKHVALVHELSRLVNARQLMYVSEIEQELACAEDFFGHTEKVQKLLGEPKIRFEEKLRVSMLFCLRYESQLFGQSANSAGVLSHIKRLLTQAALQNAQQLGQVDLLDELIKYAGLKSRASDLYGNNKGFLARATQLISSGIRGAENIYTQHKPLMGELLTELLASNGRLTNKHYSVVEGTEMPVSAGPVVGVAGAGAAAGSAINKTNKLIIIYMLGGITYEEVQYVENLNKSLTGVRLYLGGSCVHNSRSFIDELARDKHRDNSLFQQEI